MCDNLSLATDNQGELGDLGQDPEKEGRVRVDRGCRGHHRGRRGHCDNIRRTTTSRGTGMRKEIDEVSEQPSYQIDVIVRPHSK